MSETPDYRDTVFLPKTDFPMKAGLSQKEPAILARWAQDKLYEQLRNVRKGRERFATSIDDLPDATQPVAPSGASPEAELVGQETLDVVRATLASLPVAHREAFILIRFEGLSIAEAAQILDASEANVKVRAFRAYEAFRQALKGAGEKP